MIEILEANLNIVSHQAALVRLMDEYACDPMGGGKGLSDYAKANLAAELARRSTAHVLLAMVGAEAAGLVVCIEGFSTFACRPLLNIHDVIVSQVYRGQGLSKLLLQKARAESRNGQGFVLGEEAALLGSKSTGFPERLNVALLQSIFSCYKS
jgi:GNAT superfamily N-acetyltransferase